MAVARLFTAQLCMCEDELGFLWSQRMEFERKKRFVDAGFRVFFPRPRADDALVFNDLAIDAADNRRDRRAYPT